MNKFNLDLGTKFILSNDLWTIKKGILYRVTTVSSSEGVPTRYGLTDSHGSFFVNVSDVDSAKFEEYLEFISHHTASFKSMHPSCDNQKLVLKSVEDGGIHFSVDHGSAGAFGIFISLDDIPSLVSNVLSISGVSSKLDSHNLQSAERFIGYHIGEEVFRKRFEND